MRRLFLSACNDLYRFLRPVLFLSNSEKIHERMTAVGEMLGKSRLLKTIFKALFGRPAKSLEQEICGVHFASPIGLAAGFDYEARLTQFLPVLGFGFETIGTITNNPYEGNEPPRLGRLVKSRSLMVNKGFKNPGIRAILTRLKRSRFGFPVGLSVGKTNKEGMTQNEAVEDILSAFKEAEISTVPFAYYELNISCPNLHGSVEFYEPLHLSELLKKVTALNLSRPLFIKMPIDKSDEEVRGMLTAVIEFPVSGVIFGNLQKDRNHPSLDPKEVARYPKGNFSGKPTEERSNELIRLAYREYGKRLVVIGCGGVFNAEDAYKKIRLGATAVQLITGLIYEGPQLVASINAELPRLLKKDGFSNVSEAIGKDA
jgi:dihydroorotate dehydrogenase subfamily 2